MPPDIQDGLLRVPVIHFLPFHILSIQYKLTPLSNDSRYRFDPEYCLGTLQSPEVILQSNHIRLYRRGAFVQKRAADDSIFLLRLYCLAFHLQSLDTRSYRMAGRCSKERLFADSSDLARMSEEQNPLEAEPVLVPWYMSMEERFKEQVQGTKCEETTYLTDENVEIFTRTNDWPCTVVETPYGDMEVADILQK